MKTAIKIFVDADALVALTVETDTNHEKARSLLNRLTVNPVLFLTSNYVFSESITIISQRASHQTAVTFIAKMQSMESSFQITRADENIEEEAIGVFTSYVDCTNMVFMKRLDLDAIFSFDEVYRKNGLTLAEDLLATKSQAA
jgi:predicted nucleic acid-binding protein